MQYVDHFVRRIRRVQHSNYVEKQGEKLRLLWLAIKPYTQTSRHQRYPSTWDLLTYLAQTNPQMIVIDPWVYLSHFAKNKQLAA